MTTEIPDVDNIRTKAYESFALAVMMTDIYDAFGLERPKQGKTTTFTHYRAVFKRPWTAKKPKSDGFYYVLAHHGWSERPSLDVCKLENGKIAGSCTSDTHDYGGGEPLDEAKVVAWAPIDRKAPTFTIQSQIEHSEYRGRSWQEVRRERWKKAK